jgi:hypothetical protein
VSSSAQASRRRIVLNDVALKGRLGIYDGYAAKPRHALDRIVLEVAGIKGEAEYTTTASIYLEPVERYPVGSQIKTTIELPPEASLIDAHGFAVKVRLSKPCINTFSLQAPETMRVFGPFGSRVLSRL